MQPTQLPPTLQALSDLNAHLSKLQQSCSCRPVAHPIPLRLALPSLRPALTKSSQATRATGLDTFVRQWRDSLAELCSRLHNDWGLIVRVFRLPPEDCLQAIEQMGDRHADGRAVLALTFASGCHLVYKPRSLAAEVQFQTLQQWLNEVGTHPPLRSPRLVACGENYGWMEFLRNETCASEEEVSRFYRRMAVNLALLQVLQATDCHCQNVIACGEHPALVDLEALFQPRLEDFIEKQNEITVVQALQNSVERVALLPRSSLSEGQDISGMGAQNGMGDLSPLFESDQRRRFAGQHLPTLNGERVELTRFSEVFCDQFAETYRLLVGCRQELMTDSGPLSAFEDTRVRLILRDSRVYDEILRDAEGDDSRFSGTLESDARQRPHLLRSVPLEVASLRRGDIPFFQMRPGSRHVWSCVGCLPNFLGVTGLVRARQRLTMMESTDLARQLRLVRRSFS